MKKLIQRTSKMKKLVITIFVVVATLQVVNARNTNYLWDRFGQGNVLMTVNYPIIGIVSNTTQATSSSTHYLVKWGYSKWFNTNTPYNQEFTLTWGGDSYNGPDGALSAATTSGSYYTLQIEGLAYLDHQAVLMETDHAPQGFHADNSTAVSTPGSVYFGQDATIIVTLAGNKSSQEKVFIRYSTDNWATSKVVEASGSGSTWSEATAVIPAADNNPGTTIKYYAYSTTLAATNSSNHDLITLKLANNGGSNYTYTVANSWITVSDGNWSSASTWLGGIVPPNGQAVTIASDVILDQDATVSSLTINPGKTFTATDGIPRTLTILPGGTLTNNNGTFISHIYIPGVDGRVVSHVKFDGSGTVSGSFGFQDVSIAGGVNFGLNSELGRTLTINNGGFVDINAPVYPWWHPTIVYNTGTTYSRGLEWGSGDFNVQISNNTTLDMGANSGANKSFTCYGNLTVDAGSTFSMDITPMTAEFIVWGDILNNGTITLSGSSGGDLRLGGDIVNNGTFNSNNRAVILTTFLHRDQRIGGSGIFEISYLIFNASAGSVRLDTDLIVSGPNGGNAIVMGDAFKSVLNLNGHTLTIGKAGVASTINSGFEFEPGWIVGSSTSSIIILGTGPFGTLTLGGYPIGTSLNVLQNLTI